MPRNSRGRYNVVYDKRAQVDVRFYTREIAFRQSPSGRNIKRGHLVCEQSRVVRVRSLEGSSANQFAGRGTRSPLTPWPGPQGRKLLARVERVPSSSGGGPCPYNPDSVRFLETDNNTPCLLAITYWRTTRFRNVKCLLLRSFKYCFTRYSILP